MSEALIVSKQRVADHGKVFTPGWLVDAILDLVTDETERIDWRLLEPACGSGHPAVKALRHGPVTLAIAHTRPNCPE